MGLFIQQNENRSKYQEKLAAELRERASMQSASADPIDQTKDSNYVKDTVGTSDRMWLWILAILFAIIAAVIVYFFVR